MLKDELDYFIANQDELVKLYGGRVLVIRDREVKGAYDSPLDAYMAGKAKFPVGTFAVQPCEPGTNAYTLTVVSPS